MGGNSSREAGSKTPSNIGFTPLTPLKRPGSIRKLKSDDPADIQPSSRQSSEAVLEEEASEELIHASDSVATGSTAAEVLPPCDEKDEKPTVLEHEKQSVESLVSEQVESDPCVQDPPAETATQSPVVPSKAVYGAAYPPEMAEIVMKQFNGNAYGSSRVFGNLKLLSLTSEGNPTSDVSKDNAPAALAAAVEERAGHRAKAKFEKVLEEETVNLAELQSLCWSGCPPDHRADTWRLLLRYMPANSDRRESKMARLRAEYTDAVAKYFETYDAASASPYDRTMYNQIAVDLPRTNPSVMLFQNLRVQRSLHRILYVWAIRHPGTGYVQGINDLVTPFFFVFLREQTGASDEDVSAGRVMGEDGAAPDGAGVVTAAQLEVIEADCYHCLTNLLDNAQDNYVLDSRGIQEKVFMLKRIMARLDDKLVAHFERMEVEFLQFAFRWFNCLLMREFSLTVPRPRPAPPQTPPRTRPVSSGPVLPSRRRRRRRKGRRGVEGTDGRAVVGGRRRAGCVRADGRSAGIWTV